MTHYCKLCGDEITDENKSKEHIIHNAIGGILEDEYIYCKKCNNCYGTIQDKSFTDIFAPFVGGLDIHKSRKTKGSMFRGFMCDKEGNLYNVDFKSGKIWTIRDIDDKYVDKKLNQDMILLGYEFKLDDKAFRTGMAKIAFNFATHKGIEPAVMDRLFDVKSKKLLEKLIIIPFVPLTLFDTAMEAMEPEKLYHALRLFNNGKHLYVYIELFSTFQFYVLVSDNYVCGVEDDIDAYYCNYIEKNEKPQDELIRDLTPRTLKDANIIMTQYNISKEEINKAIRKSGNDSTPYEVIGEKVYDILRKSRYEHPYKDVVDDIYDGVEFHKILRDIFNSELAGAEGAIKIASEFSRAFDFYTVYDEDCVNISNYKRFLPDGSGYPETLAQVTTDENRVKEYTFQKFNMLSERVKGKINHLTRKI